MTRPAMTASPIRRAITLAAVLLCALCLTPPTLPGPTPPARALPQQAEQTDRSGPSEPAEPSDQPAGQQGGLSEFGSCLAGSGQGSVVILMDQSGSLRTTDPDRARVRAAQYLAERLASFSTTNGITLNVHVAGFAASYAGAGDWTALTPDTLETVKSRISAVGDDVQDYDTDYWNALEGARQDLVDHDASGCRAVAWLSDGEYDLDMRDSGAGQDIGTDKPYAPGVRLDSEDGVAQAEQAGTADICRPTGVADQLRSSGVTLLGLGLSDGGADFTFMRRIVGGGGTNAAANGVESCGDVSSPTGSFYPVSDIDSLLMAFDSISAAGTTVRSDSVSVCQGGACAEGESSFVVDGSLQDVHVLASSDVDGLEARLYPPGASDPIVMSQTTGPQTADGVSYEWLTGRTLQVDLAADSAPTWDGQWRLSFIDEQSRTEGEKVNVNLHLSSPLTLAWQDLATTELRQGETVDDVRLALLDHAGGRPVDTSRLTGALSATVTLTDSKGTSTTLFESDDVEDLNRPVNIPVGRDVALGEASVTTSVTVTTAPATGADGGRVDGTTLAPTQATTTVSINPPLDFPTLASPIDFGRLEEDTTAHAALAVTGPGCVWVPPDAVTLTGAPAQAGAITVVSDASSQDSCVSVPEGRTAELGLDLSADSHANGAVTGSASVMVAPLDEPDRAQAVDVPLWAEMRRPLDVGTAWTAFAIALAAGIGVPVGLLYLFTFLAARIPPGTIAVASTVVDVPDDGTSAVIDVPSREWTWVSVPRGAREVTVGPCVLRTRVGVWPTRVPYAVVVAPRAPSVSGAPVGQRGGRATVPVSLRGNWIAILDQPDSPRRVTLVMVAQGTAEVARDRLVDRAGRELAARVARLRPQAGAGARPDDAGGGSTGLADDAGGAAASTTSSSGLPTLSEDDPFAGYTSSR